MVRSLISAVVVFLCCVHVAVASDALLNNYMKDFAGRWVSEGAVDQDIEGLWKKGDTLRFVVVHAPTIDQSGMRYEWQAENNGKVVVTLYGITAWDPDNKCLRSVGFADPGFFSESTITKNEDQWVQKGSVTLPDGSKTTVTVTTTVSDDGETHTDVSTQRVDHMGSPMADVTHVWKKVSKNHEMLEKHLGWLIGTWTAKLDTADQGLVDVEATCKWIADGEVMTMNLRIGKREGLSLVLFDPSDATIKMWGANSQGGNGQAVMHVEGSELVWTNTVYDVNGKKSVSDFSYIKKDDKTMYVKYIDEVNGQEKQILNTKK